MVRPCVSLPDLNEVVYGAKKSGVVPSSPRDNATIGTKA